MLAMTSMSPPSFGTATDTDIATTLRRLVALRWWLLAGEVAAILAVPAVLGIPLPLAPMLAVSSLQVVANGLLARRIAHERAFGESELFMQVLLDIAALAVLMFFSGGAANPLISLLLPPVAIAALTLSARLVATVAVIAAAAYSLLMVVYLPLPLADAERAARLHLTGMWLTFVLSVGLVAWFVVRMTAAIRQRDAALAEAREQALRDERVIALGALAAGAAHELSTPLATMAVIAGELESSTQLDEAARADMAVLRRQVTACKKIISGLTERAGAGRLDSVRAMPADRWLAGLYARWQEMRPRARSGLVMPNTAQAPMVAVEATMEQGLLNLLNNAADTGTEVTLEADWADGGLDIRVRDRGPGFPEAVIRYAGHMPLPPRAEGSGIGLFLAHAAAQRLGGRLSLANDGGAVARLHLPLEPNDGKHPGH